MLNKVQMIGHLGNVETVNLPNGTFLAKLSVAVNKSWKDKQGVKQEKTTWFNVHAFAKLGEIINQYAKVGNLVYVEGELKQDKYTDKSGIEKMVTVILANEFKILNKKEKNTSDNRGNTAKVEEPRFLDDDIPW